MKYKIGDRVRVRQNEKKLFKFVTIKGQVTDCGYVVKENANVYTDEMLDGLYEECESDKSCEVDYSKVTAEEFFIKAEKICKSKGGCCDICCLDGNCILSYSPFSDDMNYKEVVKKTMEFGPPKPTLTDSEREYLSAVIKPFRDDVWRICKYANEDACRIVIGVPNWEIEFPKFDRSKCYNGLEQDREYTLEELGL